MRDPSARSDVVSGLPASRLFWLLEVKEGVPAPVCKGRPCCVEGALVDQMLLPGRKGDTDMVTAVWETASLKLLRA